MGLTTNSTGINAVDMGFPVTKLTKNDKVIALAGNPNVGKSTVFNELTGLRQHTGNWPGKTVSNAQGFCKYNTDYILVDIPGTYSLMANSQEEEVARDFICFGNPDAVVVICDATCLERNLNLVLQTTEITSNVIVCINLMDEAKKKEIKIDLMAISKKLGVPVVGTSARSGKGLRDLMSNIENVISTGNNSILQVKYTDPIEKALETLIPIIKSKIPYSSINYRWIALKLLDYNENLFENISKYVGVNLLKDSEIIKAVRESQSFLNESGLTKEKLKDTIVSSLILTAEDVCRETVVFENVTYNSGDRKIDEILTSKLFGFPIMIALLGFVFWLTITGANYPSSLIFKFLFWIENRFVEFSIWVGIPTMIYELLIFGVYRVLAWVVSVMLPPMAIFFPLFTLLEDLGYLPRIAFNLDKTFKKCSACGKQALTMCMGFGCNAAGIIGCRIIDSKRERLIAIMTNNFVPCNGRFPIFIAIITMFFAFSVSAPFQSVIGAALLTCVVMIGVFSTFLSSKLLSKTILKGVPTSFTLELPPYRRPRICKIIVRSIFDRTLFVLGRAVVVAILVGFIIWLFANINIADATVLAHCSNFLDPFGKLIGMDGVILLAFILGLPANEIVIPIIIMAYMSTGSLLELENLVALKQLFIDNDFYNSNKHNVFCIIALALHHHFTYYKKETGSFKWVAISFILPTITGIITCFIFSSLARLFFI